MIEQATAHINQTSPERFQAAQAMLEKALAEDPDNVEVQVALAALLMRGVQMVWLSAAERETAETKAEALLQQTLRAKPSHIPAHEAYCRFLSATNQFRASLVACARALSFDPWNGIALYHVGLAQIRTGRFEDALATFKQADRFDTPQVSRWTWMIGAGWANMLMGRAEDAVPWLQKSIAITSASGRTHMLLAAAYQQLGKTEEARAAMEKGARIAARLDHAQRPDAQKNSSQVLSRCVRTDHAVDGRGGVTGELTYRARRLFCHLDRQRTGLTAASVSRIPPAAQRVKQRYERETSRRQIIFHAQRISLEFTARDNAGVLQLAKLQSEHLVRNRGVVPAQVAEAFRALLQIVDQQTGPAAADDLHHFFDGTAGDEIFHPITRGYKKVRHLLGQRDP